MSRESRRTASTPVRLSLAESDLDQHDARFDAQDVRLGKLEETKGANRTAFFSAVATIVVGVLGFAGLIAAAVLK